MNILYFDCSEGLSVQAAVVALRDAACSTLKTVGDNNQLTDSVLTALGSLPCPPEEKAALDTLGALLRTLPEYTLYFSPLPLAKLPPAAMPLLTGVTVQPDGGPVTPAGAALVAVSGGGEPPPFTLKSSGLGRGQGALVRVFLGERPTDDEVMVLDANLDDFNPEFYPHLTQMLLEAGALDVFLTPVIMKKGRPGTQLTVLSPLTLWREHAQKILSETSTIGLRFRRESRLVLPRQMIRLNTPYGTVGAKVAVCPDGRRKVKPEYADCRKIAVTRGLPLTEVYRAALAEAWSQVPQPGTQKADTEGKGS